LKRQLEAVRSRVANQTAVPTLIVTDSSRQVAGGDNFLDELLNIAGGKNVAADSGRGYFVIDKEKIRALNPQVVLQLLGGAEAPVVEETRRFWESMPELEAVKNDRVYYLTESSILMPGLKVGETAEIFASKLHPATSQPATTQAADLPSALQGEAATFATPDRTIP
jgi:iron complex transport system substrate-binding protein